MSKNIMSEKRFEQRTGADNIQHIYPLDDIKPHDINHGGSCKCEPVTEIYRYGVTVKHNSFDGRELWGGSIDGH